MLQRMGAAPRIAIVDDDHGLMTVLGRRLRDAGWTHRVFPRALPVDELAALHVDALVLDPVVAGPDGERYALEVCARLPHLGVIVCARGSTVAERSRALRQGVDDWLAKPYHPEELMARIEAVLRRRAPESADGDRQPRVFAELTIDPGRYEAFAAGRPLRLTRREYELLRLLAGADGKVIPREEIYERVWGYAMARGDRSVDVFVRKLRRKLELASPEWRYVHTHFGIGYRFNPERTAETADGSQDRGEQPRGAPGAPG